MAEFPFGPWGQVAPGQSPPQRGALAGTAFDEFAQLYEACLRTSPSLTPPVVDEMELWEVAVVLGRALPENADQVRGQPARSMAEERVRAWKEGRPQPQFDQPQPLPPGLTDLIPSNLPAED